MDAFDTLTIDAKTTIVHREMFKELLIRYKDRGIIIKELKEKIRALEDLINFRENK